VNSKLKKISYRGGIVVFRIPANWREEYEPEGGGTFYENQPDSGTLRLNVLSFEAPSNESCEQAAGRVFPAGSFEVLPSGLCLRHHMLPGKENGEFLHIHRWEIAIPIPPKSFNLVCFAYTIVAGQESTPRIAAELKLVDLLVRSAEFGRVPGVSGHYFHDGNA
jgi:hypothetical protein